MKHLPQQMLLKKALRDLFEIINWFYIKPPFVLRILINPDPSVSNMLVVPPVTKREGWRRVARNNKRWVDEREGKRKTERGKRDRGNGSWVHSVTYVYGCTCTFNRQEQNAAERREREGWKVYRERLRSVSREAKGGGVVRYAMCEITITHPP